MDPPREAFFFLAQPELFEVTMAIIDCPGKPSGPFGQQETIEAEIHVVTPMFGGGFKAREPDPDNPVRATAIRGHLQFWWRATHRAPVGLTSKELFDAQELVWGSTKRKSPVTIQIEFLNRGVSRQLQPGQNQWISPFDSQALRYAVFPFQATNESPAANFLQGVKFKLTATFPAGTIGDSVKRALTAWINFGGIGSRTRRGCGSLFSSDWSFQSPKAATDWVGQFDSGPQHPWPSISSSLLFEQMAGDPVDAWRKAIEPLQLFRQGIGVARNRQDNGFPGRSFFPEPETIRKLTKKRWEKHQDLHHPMGFPRAEFGMPIVVHFKDKNRGEPGDTTIVPGGDKERMASPLILKPLATKNDEAFPIILRLNTPPLEKVSLESGGRIVPNSSLPVHSPHFGQIKNSPMAGHSSALEAFLDFALEEGFQKGGI